MGELSKLSLLVDLWCALLSAILERSTFRSSSPLLINHTRPTITMAGSPQIAALPPPPYCPSSGYCLPLPSEPFIVDWGNRWLLWWLHHLSTILFWDTANVYGHVHLTRQSTSLEMQKTSLRDARPSAETFTGERDVTINDDRKVTIEMMTITIDTI